MPTTERVSVTDVRPELLATWVDWGGTTVVDVLKDFEYAEERIQGAVLAPLSAFDPDEVRVAQGDASVVFRVAPWVGMMTVRISSASGLEPLIT
ncbi:MAG: hypothetical protein AAGI53_00725 [Planctomycetota bacterium]